MYKLSLVFDSQWMQIINFLKKRITYNWYDITLVACSWNFYRCIKIDNVLLEDDECFNLIWTGTLTLGLLGFVVEIGIEKHHEDNT